MNHEAEHREYEAYLNDLQTIPVLAEYTQYAQDGEAWVHTKVFPKITEDGRVIRKTEAFDAAGFEQSYSDRMGEANYGVPKITGTDYSWVVEQTGYANV